MVGTRSPVVMQIAGKILRDAHMKGCQEIVSKKTNPAADVP